MYTQATFPKQLRYFSIATYDTHGMPLQVITDYQIQPKTGACFLGGLFGLASTAG